MSWTFRYFLGISQLLVLAVTCSISQVYRLNRYVGSFANFEELSQLSLSAVTFENFASFLVKIVISLSLPENMTFRKIAK